MLQSLGVTAEAKKESDLWGDSILSHPPTTQYLHRIIPQSLGRGGRAREDCKPRPSHRCSMLPKNLHNPSRCELRLPSQFLSGLCYTTLFQNIYNFCSSIKIFFERRNFSLFVFAEVLQMFKFRENICSQMPVDTSSIINRNIAMISPVV